MPALFLPALLVIVMIVLLLIALAFVVAVIVTVAGACGIIWAALKTVKDWLNGRMRLRELNEAREVQRASLGRRNKPVEVYRWKD